MKFWKKNNDYKMGETLFELVEESKTNDSKHFKRYKNPVTAAADANNMIRDIKRNTLDTRNIFTEK